MADEYEVVVAGGGIAGLTAGLTAARLGRTTLVLTGGAPGGLLLGIEKIEGLPGFPNGISGYELCPLAQEQAAAAGAEFSMTELEGIEAQDGSWRVGNFIARAVILATGSRFKSLGVLGEERLRGRGVSHCASCDAPLLQDRAVGVIGGGDSACQEALALAEFASEVIMLHRREGLSAQATYQRRVFEHPKIAVRYGAVVEEILGEERVTGVTTRDLATGDAADLELAGVFVYVGLQVNTEYLDGLLRLDGDGRVPTDGWLRTELPGVFAAGIIRHHSLGQAATAAGDGAAAAFAAHRYLAERSWPAVGRPKRTAMTLGNGGSYD